MAMSLMSLVSGQRSSIHTDSDPLVFEQAIVRVAPDFRGIASTVALATPPALRRNG